MHMPVVPCVFYGIVYQYSEYLPDTRLVHIAVISGAMSLVNVNPALPSLRF
jgi:hypothetical protein